MPIKILKAGISEGDGYFNGGCNFNSAKRISIFSLLFVSFLRKAKESLRGKQARLHFSFQQVPFYLMEME